MVLQEVPTKIVNISVLSYKFNNSSYELAVYPNKLYEYFKHKNINLNQILHTTTVYRNISKGEKCTRQELKKLQLFIGEENDLIKYILDHGYERKPLQTKAVERQQIEAEIIEIIQKKIKYNGKFVGKEMLREFIRKIYRISEINVKKQVSEIIKKLEKIGFERVKYKVKVINKLVSNDDAKKLVSNTNDEKLVSNENDEKLVSNANDEKLVSNENAKKLVSNEKVVSNNENAKKLVSKKLVSNDEKLVSNNENAKKLVSKKLVSNDENAIITTILNINEKLVSNCSYLVKSDLLPAFLKNCETQGFDYFISNVEEEESEEIC
ncbi:hypothetical protein NUSPORA_01443 [Nucleospora cyclopteri]